MSATGSSPAPEAEQIRQGLHRLRSVLARLKAEIEIAMLDETSPTPAASAAIAEAFRVASELETLLLGHGLERTASESGLVSGRGRVFVVDDDARLAELTARQLRRRGFDSVARSHVFDLMAEASETDSLVIDFGVLTELDSDAAAWVWARGPIVISGAVERQAQTQSESMGAAAYLIKPVDADVLAGTIKRRFDAARP